MIFSVIIPTKNRPESLINAIRSVQDQTFTDWEVIVVDDASDERTAAAVRPLLSERIRYVRNERSLGPGGSRNAGIRLADKSSAFISLLDDDDMYFPDFLRNTYEAFKVAPDSVGFSWTAIENYYESTGKVDTFFWDPPYRNKEEAFQGFLEKRLIGTGYGITFRRSVFAKVGYFDESLRAVEDTDFFLRVLKEFFYIKISTVSIRITRQSSNHVNTDSRERAEALQVIYNKHRESILGNKAAWYNFKAKISSIYYRIGDRKKAREVLSQAISEHFNVRILILWLRLELKHR